MHHTQRSRSHYFVKLISLFLAIILAITITFQLLQAPVAQAGNNQAPTSSTNSAFSTSRLAPAAPSVVATKRDELLVDNDSDSAADPGDALQYTIVISNNGTTEATGIVFTDTIDANTTLSGTVKTTPLVSDDVYTAVGNIHLPINAASGLLANDTDPDGGALTISAFDATSANGGDVVVNTGDGSFTYDPPAGFEGIDTFTYTVQDTDTNTVTAAVTVTVSGMYWFIDNSQGAGDGRYRAPFNSITAFNNAALPEPGDKIFLYSQNGSNAGYTDGIVLQNNQELTGEGVGLVVAGTVVNIAAGPAPTISDSSGNGIDLGQNNTIRGLTVGNTPNGTGIAGSSVGTVTVSDVTISGTGKAVDINGGTLAMAFDSLASQNSTTQGVNLTNTSGSLTAVAGSIVDPTGTAFNVSGGSASVTYGGSISKDNAGRLVEIDSVTGGTLNFNGTIASASSASSGIRVANSSGAANATFADVDLGTAVNRLTNDAVTLANNSGTGTFTFSDLQAFTNNARGLVSTTDGNVTVTSGAIDATGSFAGAAIDVANTQFNATFSSVTANNSGGGGIHLQNNSGTATFSGLTITHTGSTGFLANSAGTVNVTGATNTINATNGIAVNIAGTTIGGSGVTFQGISASGGTSGIILSNTGTGTFTANGGTIQNTSGDGVSLDTVMNVTLDGVTIDSSGIHGIDGNNVTNFALQNNSLVRDAGNDQNEDGLHFTELYGAVTISDSTIQNSQDRNVHIVNTTGTISSFTISNSTIRDIQAGLVTGGDGFYLALSPGGNGTVTQMDVTNSSFLNHFANGLRLNIEGDGSVGEVNVSGNTFTNNNVGIDLATNGNGDINFDINNNPQFSGATTQVNLANNGDAGSIMQGRIRNNPSIVSPAANFAFGIWIVSDGDGTIVVDVDNNTITDFGDSGIDVESRGGSGNVQATIRNNSIDTLSGFPVAGVFLRAGNGTAGETNTLCVNLVNNTADGGAGAIADYYLEKYTVATAFQIQGLTPASGATPAQVESYVASTDTSATASAYVETAGVTTNYTAATCTTVAALRDKEENVVERQEEAPLRAPSHREAEVASKIEGAPSGEVATNPTAEWATPLPANDIATTAVKFQPHHPSISPPTRGKPAPFLARRRSATFLLPPDISLNIGTLPAGESITITFDVTINDPLPAGVAAVANQGAVSGSNFVTVLTDDPDTGTAADATVTPIDAAPDLQLSKDDGGITAAPGDTIVYTLTATNTGTQGASGVVLSDTVPANTTFNAAAGTAGWSCVPDGSAGSSCTFDVPFGLPGGGGGSIVTFAVTVDDPLPQGVQEVVNTAEISDDGNNGTDLNPADNRDSDTTPIDAGSDLQITKEDGGITVLQGDTIPYTLTYSNTGSQNGTGVVISDTVPANTTFNAAASSAGWSCVPDGGAGSGCTFNVAGGLPVGSSGTITFAVTVDDPFPQGVQEVVNTAEISGDGSNGADLNPADNRDSDTTPVGARPDLQISKNDGGITAAAGETITYTLTYTNAGFQVATGVVISEVIPANTVYNATASAAGWTCVPDDSAGSTCTYSVAGPLPADGSGQTITFAVTLDDPLPGGISAITNTVSIGDDGVSGADLDTADNSDILTTPLATMPQTAGVFLPLVFNSVINAPDLVVESITVLPDDVIIVVGNQGNTAVSDAFWVDLYINPDPPPTAVNQTWEQVADEGLVWGVEDVSSLTPGGTLTLTLSHPGYRPDLSNFSGTFTAGTEIYVQVDSADVNTTYGSVLEEHELTGGTYNNIAQVTAASALGTTVEKPAGNGEQRPFLPGSLPPRP